jgi:uncharacterized protein (TIGR03790 family)
MNSPSFFVRVACAALAVMAGGNAWAGGGSENLFLIVNPSGAKSKEVANHYIALRHIPPGNILYLPLPPNANEMTGLNFREKLLKPTLAAIERRGLKEQIDQIVYSCEFPWRIDFSAMFPAAAGGPGPKQLAPVASLTGATYLYSFVNDTDANLIQLNTNFYCLPIEEPQTASRAFRHKYLWGPDGKRVDAGGLQYYLATQLGSTAPTGNTTEEIISYLQRSAGADGTRPEGVFYYMNNSDVRTRVRQPHFAAAVNAINSLGLKAAVLNGVVPSGRPDVAGLTTGSANVPLRGSGAVLLPGALVDNLTSQGGFLARPASAKPQTRLSEYLRLGAAGASGTVIEPYAIAQKFPSPALHLHYARGSSMAEAFYQSIQGPYQLLILGDPLCQPWAMIPEVTVAGLEVDALSGTVEIKPTVKLAPGRKVARMELYVDGKLREAGGPFTLDTTKLADGFHELRVVATDDTPLETQGRWIGDVMVKNGRDAVSLVAPGGSTTGAAQITLTLSSTVNADAAVFHNGREVGRVTGVSAKLTIATDQLGRGPVTLQARTFGKPLLSSRPLRLEIE